MEEFPQNETLTRLSRQNLKGLGMEVPEIGNPGIEEIVARPPDVQRVELARLAALKKASPDLVDGADEKGWRPIHHAASKGWMEVLEGQKSWTLSGEGLVVYNDAGKATPDDIYGHLSSRTVIYIEFGSEATDEKYYSGTGYFTEFSTDAGVEDNATFSFSF